MSEENTENTIPQNLIETMKVMLKPYSENEIKNAFSLIVGENPAGKDELLTLKEAADLLKVSKPTLRKYEQQGLLKFIKPDPRGHKVFVSRNSIKWQV